LKILEHSILSEIEKLEMLKIAMLV